MPHYNAYDSPLSYVCILQKHMYIAESYAFCRKLCILLFCKNLYILQKVIYNIHVNDNFIFWFQPINNVYQHKCAHGNGQIYVKGERAPGECWVSLKNWFFCIFMKSPPSLLNNVSVAASISMATSLHHPLKLNGATPRTGRSLVWVTNPLRNTPVCVLSEEWGGGFLNSLADNLCHSCSITLLPTLLEPL